MIFKKTFLLACLFLLFSMLAKAEFGFGPLPESVSIEKGLQASISLEFSNESGKDSSITVSAGSPNENLFLELHENFFTLHPNESTSFSLTIKPSAEIPNGSYPVRVTAQDDQNFYDRTVNVSVFGADDFDFSLETPNLKACVQENTFLSTLVTVNNNSAGAKNFSLYSDSDMFAPSFEDETLLVDGFSGKSSLLEIHVNQSHPNGTYEIPVIAMDEDGKIVEKALFLTIENCQETGFFEASLDRDSITLKDFDEETVNLTVKNLLDREQKVFASVDSPVEVLRPPFEITLLPLEEREFQIVFSSNETDIEENTSAEVHVWNADHFVKKEISIRIEKERDIQFTVLNNNLSERICSAVDLEVFEIEVFNAGREKETISFDIENPYDSIGVTIPDDEITLYALEKKTVKVVVTPSFDASTGKKEIVLVARSENTLEEFEEILSFTVVSAFDTPFENVLLIASAPTELRVQNGQELSFNVTVKNNGNVTLYGTEIRVFGGLKGEVEFGTATIDSLLPNEAKTVPITMTVSENASPRKYVLTIEAKSGINKATQQTTLLVTGKQAMANHEAEENGLLAGLVSFGLSGTGISFIIIIILIICIAIVVMYLLSGSNNSVDLAKQPWLRTGFYPAGYARKRL